MNTTAAIRFAFAALLCGTIFASGQEPAPRREVNPEAKLHRFSTTIEKERPQLDEETKRLIAAFRRNPMDANRAALRAKVAANYDAVVARKKAKLEDLKKTARHQSKVDEMQIIVDEMLRDREARIDASMARFTDSRFRPGLQNTTDGYLPVLGAPGRNVCISKTPVTAGEWAKFTKKTVDEGQDKLPVTGVSIQDAERYCAYLTELVPAHVYRLPTEAEWELAAGHMPKDAAINAADVETGPTDVYYYYSLYGNGACSLSGTLDMWGNVWEWLDTPHEEGQMKIKGGTFDEPRSQCRTEERGNGRDPSQGYPNVGFRILRETNWAAVMLEKAAGTEWLANCLPGSETLTAADYRILEEDPDGDGIPSWAEFVAQTNPNDATSKFSATISLDSSGNPVIGWNTPTYVSRRYRIYGKVELSDSVWLEVKDNAEVYRFFRILVDLR